MSTWHERHLPTMEALIERLELTWTLAYIDRWNMSTKIWNDYASRWEYRFVNNGVLQIAILDQGYRLRWARYDIPVPACLDTLDVALLEQTCYKYTLNLQQLRESE